MSNQEIIGEIIQQELTEQEKIKLRLLVFRNHRNDLLNESDKYISQIDRYTVEQINELKVYRQSLRDYININLDIIQEGQTNMYNLLPIKPSFI